MFKLCQKAIDVGMVHKYTPGVHFMEVQTKSGLYWARCWENPENGNFCIVCDMNGEMIESAEPGVMLDIGANVGRYTIPMSTKATVVHAFEPEVHNYLELCENIERYLNIVPVPLAVSNITGTQKLHLVDKREQHSMIEGLIYNSIKETVEVNTITLDDYCENNNLTGITAIKIDVEGAEAMVFEGARRTLKQENPLIALETHVCADLKTVSSILAECGYEILAPNGQIIKELSENMQVICRKT